MAGGGKSSQATWILIGLAVGLVLGVAADFLTGPEGPLAASGGDLGFWVTQVIRPIGQLFIRLIFMVVMPLIFSAIVLGALEMGDLGKLGRTGLKCLWVTLLLASISVFIGLVAVNVVRPGDLLDQERKDALIAQYAGDAADKVEQAKQAKPIAETFLGFIPANPLYEAVMAFTPNYTGGGVIAVMVFALLFGIGLLSLAPEKRTALTDVCQGLFDVSLVLVNLAMRLAPVCVGCLTFSVAATLGLDIVKSLGVYALVVIGALLLHQFGTYSLFLWFWAKRSPWQFFGQIREAMITAFSTSSSNATLPVSLRVAEENLGLPRQISRFVLTVGASANQNGTALYEGVTVLFLAQVYGVDLSIFQQVVVALLCIMAGIGTAGVPGGSLPLVVGVLATIGVPGELIAIIIGIDRLLDMCRTTLNVTGDLVCAVLVAGPDAKTPPTTPAPALPGPSA